MRFYLRLTLLDNIKIVIDGVAQDRYEDDEDDRGEFIFDRKFREHSIYYNNYFRNVTKKLRKRGKNRGSAFASVNLEDKTGRLLKRQF
jgi:hypothetical protein